MEIRVRFPPSPTGNLHIGNLRVAIFNWLFAKHNNGKFLVRIEDTDLERSKPEYVESIYKSLEWISISSDEPVVIQSDRIAEHKKLIEKLISQGKAYRCFCSRKDTDEESEESFGRYDGSCRNRVVTEEDLKKPYVIRFKLPEISQRSTVSFDDLIHGTVTISLDQLDDFVFVRSDGTPMYNFVVVADDNYMRISHVIRGEDHISNTHKQILLYEALGFEIPKFGHLPMILNAQGAKLSKRDAAVAVLDYKKNGFLPEAFVNYLVRLGWSHGDQEVFTKDELIKYFSLEHVGKSGAIFDLQKLEWFNSVYMRNKSANELLAIIQTDVDPEFRKKIKLFNDEQLLILIELYKERSKTLNSLVQHIMSLEHTPEQYDETAVAQWVKFETMSHLQELIAQLENVKQWSVEDLSNTVKELCKKFEIKLALLAQPIRIALTGNVVSPGIFELLNILGKNESIERLNKFLKFLKLNK